MENILEELSLFAAPLAVSMGGILETSFSVAILGGLFAAVIAYALFFGKKTMVASLFSLIFAGFLFAVFPYRDMLIASFGGNQQNELLAQGALFAAFSFFSFFAIRQSIRGTGYIHEGTRKLLNALCLALAASGLLSAYAYQFTPVRELNPISSSFLAPLITAPQAPFWWIAGALLVVYLFSEQCISTCEGQSENAFEAQSPLVARLERQLALVLDQYYPYTSVGPHFSALRARAVLEERFCHPRMIDAAFLGELLEYALRANWGASHK